MATPSGRVGLNSAWAAGLGCVQPRRRDQGRAVRMKGVSRGRCGQDRLRDVLRHVGRKTGRGPCGHGRRVIMIASRVARAVADGNYVKISEPVDPEQDIALRGALPRLQPPELEP
eukprot:GHVU01235988.1.p3 GENE.GHVU01235988.1~~GHVU01235988.1.p3  ORF type:complete len:115 (-),score=3.42 GHVU01235988.1:64-408(-)